MYASETFVSNFIILGVEFHIFIIELQYQYFNKLHYSHTSIAQNFEKKITIHVLEQICIASPDAIANNFDDIYIW